MRIQADPTFAPCPVEDGDELFPNGIFVFNVTRILEHVARHPAEFALVQVSVRSFPRWDRPFVDADVEAADLARPVLLAEISPGSFNLIDGHHRLEKARRWGVETLPAYRLTVAQHLRFLTSARAYLAFVRYWNGKVRLLLVHNMGPTRAYCTLWADGLVGLLPHLTRPSAVALLTPDPPEVQRAIAESRGWPPVMASDPRARRGRSGAAGGGAR